MTLWCHGWGCKPSLTASHIHIGCIESVWAPLYAVDWHVDAPLHCYTCAGGGQILENWGKAEPKWRCGVMVGAVNHHWLHPTSILDVHKVIEHLHMLWMGIWVRPYTVIPVPVGVKFWKFGCKVKPKWQCGVMVEAVNHHWLHPTSILDVYKVIEHLHMLWIGIDAPLHCYTCAGGGQILENWGKVKLKWHCGVTVEAVNDYWLHPTSILDV